MISILAPGGHEERFLREILAPLRQTVETYSADSPPPDSPPALAVIWLADGKDGTAAAQKLALEARRTIILTAPYAEAIEAAHMMGADALFTVPVRPGQIADRARTFLEPGAAARLPAAIDLKIYDFYPRENRVHHKLTHKDLRLTDKERDILLTLHGAGGKAVSRQDLLDAVWAYAPDVETHTLETHIYRLRQKIEKDPAAPEIVITDESGYKIIPC